jgi:hypothetical protein
VRGAFARLVNRLGAWPNEWRLSLQALENVLVRQRRKERSHTLDRCWQLSLPD